MKMSTETNSTKKKMNLPNKLTVLRMFLVPVFMAVMLLPIGKLMPDSLAWWLPRTIAALIFIVSSVTDLLDGKIARKYNLVTDFGKFLDPLADKTLVIGALLACSIAYCEQIGWALGWVTFIVIFREFAVTSMRLVVVNTSGIVVAASMLGKIKTVSQIVAISTVFLEPVVQLVVRWIAEAVTGEKLCWRTDIVPLTWLSLVFAVVMTVWSGLNYIKAYWKYLDPAK